MPETSGDMCWTDMKTTTVPLPKDPAVKIGGFDNIMVTLVSPENGKPHNEPAKVLDCRLHPDCTYFLLVSWWFERRALSKNLVGFKRYLDRSWPADEPFKFVLGCHFDVITNDAITEKMEDDERFCNSMVYGGVNHNCELFSDVPDEIERRKYLTKGAKGEARLVEEQKQRSLFRMLLHPEMSKGRKDFTTASELEPIRAKHAKEANCNLGPVICAAGSLANSGTSSAFIAPMAPMWVEGSSVRESEESSPDRDSDDARVVQLETQAVDTVDRDSFLPLISS
jgi:hypothetical protein